MRRRQVTPFFIPYYLSKANDEIDQEEYVDFYYFLHFLCCMIFFLKNRKFLGSEKVATLSGQPFLMFSTSQCRKNTASDPPACHAAHNDTPAALMAVNVFIKDNFFYFWDVKFRSTLKVLRKVLLIKYMENFSTF